MFPLSESSRFQLKREGKMEFVCVCFQRERGETRKIKKRGRWELVEMRPRKCQPRVKGKGKYRNRNKEENKVKENEIKEIGYFKRCNK